MFSEEIIQKVWEKGNKITSKNPDTWRLDQCGNLIKRENYGDRESSTGWEIDHKKTKSIGGTDNLSNLRPLHWEQNASKQDRRLNCK